MTSQPDIKEADNKNQNAADEKAKKEEMVEAKMRMIKKKNEELLRRQKEIEEDRKNADLYSEMAVKRNPGNFHIDSSNQGWGKGRGQMLQQMRKQTMKAKEWEAKRKENVKKEEEAQRKQGAHERGPASRFLADDDRVDMSRARGRNEHSWGGGNFNNVVSRVQREKEASRSGRYRGNSEMNLSGKERQEYKKWKEERSRIDEERKARQKKAGNWSRAWDQPKMWDTRKKMWLYENDTDDHRFRGERREDYGNSEDWGRDGRRRQRIHQDQESGNRGSAHNSNFSHYKEGGKVTEEDWGDSTENNIGSDSRDELKESGVSEMEKKQVENSRALDGKEDDDNVGRNRETLQERKVDETDAFSREGAGVRHGENSGANGKSQVLPSEEEETAARKDAAVDQQHCTSNGTNSVPVVMQCNPDIGENGGKEFGPREDKHVTLETSENSQKEFEQRQNVTNADLIITTTDLEPEVKNKVLLETGRLSETISDEPKSNISGRQDMNAGNNKCESQPDNELSNHEGENAKTGFSAEEVVSGQSHSSDKGVIHGHEEAGAHGSVMKKAVTLPKLVTKAEEKASIDSEDNGRGKEDVKNDALSETIGDIPPTPDFLKYDHSMDWGDIEVDESSLKVTEPKW